MKGKILVSGAHGFIGSNLVKRLREESNQVFALDREYLIKPNKLKALLSDLKPKVIYHLAAYGNHHYQKDIRQIFKTNLWGTFNLLRASMNIDFESFINTGSSSEYGRKDQPMNEEMLPETDTFYGATKLGATYLAKAFAKQYKLPIVSIRPFSVYGPGEADFRFIPTIIRCCLEEKILNLAPGVHDWIYIDDLIDGIITVSKNAGSLSGEIVNIGTGVQYSNQEVVNMVEKICQKKVKIKYTQPETTFDTNKKWVADIDKIKTLGWIPKTDLPAGILKTINAASSNKK